MKVRCKKALSSPAFHFCCIQSERKQKDPWKEPDAHDHADLTAWAKYATTEVLLATKAEMKTASSRLTPQDQSKFGGGCSSFLPAPSSSPLTVSGDAPQSDRSKAQSHGLLETINENDTQVVPAVSRQIRNGERNAALGGAILHHYDNAVGPVPCVSSSRREFVEPQADTNDEAGNSIGVAEGDTVMPQHINLGRQSSTDTNGYAKPQDSQKRNSTDTQGYLKLADSAVVDARANSKRRPSTDTGGYLRPQPSATLLQEGHDGNLHVQNTNNVHDLKTTSSRPLDNYLTAVYWPSHSFENLGPDTSTYVSLLPVVEEVTSQIKTALGPALPSSIVELRVDKAACVLTVDSRLVDLNAGKQKAV
jgi:hypothetical protein